MTRGLSRRQALAVVGGMVGSLYSTTVAKTTQGRVMLLALDDIVEIVIRYRGKEAHVSPGMILDALSGKGE